MAENSAATRESRLDRCGSMMMTLPSWPVRLTSNHAVVFHQLDDLNAMSDALAAAVRDHDAEHIANLRASLGRFIVAMGWSAEAVLPALLAYVDKHAAFAEDLFAPAFILPSIAPEAPETAAILARLPESVRALLAFLDEWTIR